MKYYNDEYLQHFGVKGMKWGVRRYQKKNGSLTPVGKKRYSEDNTSETKKSRLTDKQKKAIKAGVAVAGTALAAYGAYKVSKFIKDKHVELSVERGRQKAVDIIRQNRSFDKYNEDKILRDAIKNKPKGLRYGTGEIPKYYEKAKSARAEVRKANLEEYSHIYDKTLAKAKQTAQTDKFSVAAKDVYQHYKKKRKK